MYWNSSKENFFTSDLFMLLNFKSIYTLKTEHGILLKFEKWNKMINYISHLYLSYKHLKVLNHLDLFPFFIINICSTSLHFLGKCLVSLKHGFKVNAHNNHYSTFYLLNFPNGLTDVSEKVRQTCRFVEVKNNHWNNFSPFFMCKFATIMTCQK